MRAIDPVTRLEKLVKLHGSQLAAAKTLGISQPYLNDMLRGQRRISKNVLARMGLKPAAVEA